MRILLLNPPFIPKFSRSSRSPAVTKGGTIYYCIWLAYATGVLEKAGHECKLVDAPATGKNLNEIRDLVKRVGPEMLIVDTSTASIYNDVKVAGELKKLCGAFTVLVGTHPSALPVETLKINDGVDAVAIREYDYTLRELAEKVEKGKIGAGELKKINGLAFRKGDKIFVNKERAPIKNLDELPFVSGVYKKHLNIRDYFYSANLYPEITLVTGRGCPFNCKFCNWVQNLHTGAYRKRSVANVVEEFMFIEKEFPEAKEVFIEDDTFTGDQKWVRGFCRAKIKAGLGIRWSCNARADVSLETLKLMKDAGCRLLCVGFESGSQEILNSVRKGTTLGKISMFMDDAKKAGVLVHGCFMVGNQGETEESVKATISMAKKLNPDTAQFFPIMVYPGTETYNEFREKGYLVTEDFGKWVDERGWHNCMVSRPGLSNKRLVELCDRARKEFYLRPAYIARKTVQFIIHGEERGRILKAGKTFFKYIMGR